MSLNLVPTYVFSKLIYRRGKQSVSVFFGTKNEISSLDFKLN
jgi:hypothetical protein